MDADAAGLPDMRRGGEAHSRDTRLVRRHAVAAAPIPDKEIAVMEVEDFAVPIHTLSDGREFITEMSVFQCPEIGDFVKRFSNYWAYDLALCGWTGPIR